MSLPLTPPHSFPANSWGRPGSCSVPMNAKQLFYLGSLGGPFSRPLGPATLLLGYLSDSDGTGHISTTSLHVPAQWLASGLHTCMNGELATPDATPFPRGQ